jgi:hypothetical protein
LGDVRELAVISVDGKVVSTAWHAPFEVDLTSVLSPGTHELDIKVVNLWVNRLIGDQQPGATPVAFAPQSPYTAQSSLRHSGLLGPVRILARDAVGPAPAALGRNAPLRVRKADLLDTLAARLGILRDPLSSYSQLDRILPE